VRCRACDTPLVRPGRVSNWRFERALGAACVVAIACALLWMLASRSTGTGAPIVVAVAGGLVGAAARAAARARGTAVQVAAFLGFIVFFLFGEALLFQKALLPRLVAMHALEGAEDPELEAQHEIQYVERLPFDEKIWHFLRVEVTLGLFVALAAGGGLVLLVTRAPLAVAAFEERRRIAIVAEYPGDEPGDSGEAAFEPAEVEPETADGDAYEDADVDGGMPGDDGGYGPDDDCVA